MRRSCCALAYSLALLAGAHARAEPVTPRAALEVVRGAGTDSCIEQGELERAVDRRLGRPVFGGNDLRVSLRFERRERTFTAEVVLSDRRGTALGRRELKTQAPHCSSLDDSLALVVALLVDSPEAREQAAASASATANVVPASIKPPSAAPRVTLTIPPDVTAARQPYRVLGAISVAAVVGPLPGVAFGPELLLSVRPPHFAELRLRPSLFPEREVNVPGRESGGRLSLVQVALDVCPLEHERGRVRLSGCLGQSVGWVRGEGFGYVHNAETGSLVYSLGAGGSALVALAGPLGLQLGLGAALPLQRDTYISQSADGVTTEVFRSGVVTGMLSVGLAVEL